MRTSRDLHTALKNEVTAQATGPGLRLALVKMQWGRDDVAYSLHAGVSEFTLSGFQRTDLLGRLGFQHSACPFMNGQCYATWASADLNLTGFASAFERAYNSVKSADQLLNDCGYVVEQTEGWKAFGGGVPRGVSTGSGDGHSGAQLQLMKQAEDDYFRYLFSWIGDEGRKGWTTHYQLKGPESPEMRAALEFLRTRRFGECPYLDFDPCHYRVTPFEGRSAFGAENAHRWFDQHPGKFSKAVELLLNAHADLEPYGFSFLKTMPNRETRTRQEIRQHTSQPVAAKQPSASDQQFDVAISFAGTQRELAEELATRVRDAGFSVFYDNFYAAELWGKNLVEFFDEVYRKRSRFCVMFISADYAERMWTNHERRSAQARALELKGSDYILPIRVDDAELPGMPPTTAYLSATQYSIAEIASLLIQKLTGL